MYIMSGRRKKKHKRNPKLLYTEKGNSWKNIIREKNVLYYSHSIVNSSWKVIIKNDRDRDFIVHTTIIYIRKVTNNLV